MKKMIKNCGYLISIVFLLTIFSCEDKKIPGLSEFGNTTIEDVRLADFTNSSITVAWSQIEDAASYTVQLLNDLDSDVPIDQYTTVSGDSYKFVGLNEITGYYIRVRANFNTFKNPVMGDWLYITDDGKPGRVMPKYGFVDGDFEEPEPEPEIELQLYPDFPEGFEDHDDTKGARKSSYTGNGPTGTNTDFFATGEWVLERTYTTNSGTALIHKVGTFAAMLSPNIEAYVEMNFDLPYGAKKLSFVTGIATRTNANDLSGLPIIIKVEYSTDGGSTWTQIGEEINIGEDDIETQYTPEYKLDIEEPVRFRISKSASLARPILDEIAVYY